MNRNLLVLSASAVVVGLLLALSTPIISGITGCPRTGVWNGGNIYWQYPMRTVFGPGVLLLACGFFGLVWGLLTSSRSAASEPSPAPCSRPATSRP